MKWHFACDLASLEKFTCIVKISYGMTYPTIKVGAISVYWMKLRAYCYHYRLDGIIKVWDYSACEPGKLLRTSREHDGWVTSFLFW